MGNWLDAFRFDDLLHAIVHRWKTIASAAAGIAILLWLSTALAQINIGEVGIVQRFGTITADLEPGLHIRWPWPVETIVRVRPQEIRTVEVGFRGLSEPNESSSQDRLRRPAGGADAGFAWSSPHSEGVARLSDEAVMITGDGDLVEILATVRYRISEPRKFLFAVADPEAIIRSAAESVLRELVASQRFWNCSPSAGPAWSATPYLVSNAASPKSPPMVSASPLTASPCTICIRRRRWFLRTMRWRKRSKSAIAR